VDFFYLQDGGNDNAEAVVLRGESQRQVAASLGVSLYTVRQHVEHIRALAERETLEHWQQREHA